MIEYKEVTITPDKARHMLSRNMINNRRLDSNRVAQYARDMANGSWHQNGETIKFTSSGMLVDGQHRLSAIVRAGKPVKMTVAVGVDLETIGTIDSGAGRTTVDRLRIRGVDAQECSNNTVALARCALRYFEAINKMSDEDYLSFIRKNSETIETVRKLNALTSRHRPNKTPPAVMALFVFIAIEHMYPVEDLRMFIQSYTTAEYFPGKGCTHAVNLRETLKQYERSMSSRANVVAALRLIEDTYEGFTRNTKTIPHRNKNRLIGGE